MQITGRVQGVGFRPFVYNLAQRLGLTGWVRNQAGSVEIVIQGRVTALTQFQREILASAPPLAQPVIECVRPIPLQAQTSFVILASVAGAPHQARVPPDLFTCEDCLAEMRTHDARRYRYPFTNCTQCGPRYTIMAALPYDRPNTAMANFALCPDCLREYHDPADRRFHAQPLACPVCGPQLRFTDVCHPPPLLSAPPTGEAALAAAIAALQQGQVVGIQGIGGYHLVCLAESDAAIARLRAQKPRPHKPLAIMAPWQGADGLQCVRHLARPSATEEALLVHPMRPIVLVQRRTDAPLSAQVAPGVQEVGVMLPYSPLHHLLLEALGAPIVATSGNRAGEPVMTDPTQASDRLGHVATSWLHHNRPILRPADDPVYRVIADIPRPLRLGRGNAPLEYTLARSLARPVLAVGGQSKNTVALAWERRVVISPHIGDLSTPRGMDVFTQVGHTLQALYGVTAEQVVCDAHPGYAATRWAQRSGLPVVPVGHHAAHASALLGEHDPARPALVFTWDGVGMGEGGALWGGEALVGCAGAWRRRATFRPFRPPSGDQAAREPWRSLAALLWEVGQDLPTDADALRILARRAWEQRWNAPTTHAVGRLFDAAAARILGIEHTSFEGQAPMYLEAAAHGVGHATPLPLRLEADGLWITDWQPWLETVMDGGFDPAIAAADFHTTLAHALLAQACVLREETGWERVGLTGGVFQNRRLTEQSQSLLEAHGFTVLLAREIPCNDGGLAFGQVVELLYRTDAL